MARTAQKRRANAVKPEEQEKKKEGREEEEKDDLGFGAKSGRTSSITSRPSL